MQFTELSHEQRRQTIDAKQAFAPWREADKEFRHSYRGSMRWKRVNGAEYLYRSQGRVETSVGRRSAGTEKIKDAYLEQRTRLRQRRSRLDQRLKAMEKINRAFGLGRMPVTAARVLRKLDQAGLLGRQLFVVGTHSLYAYEAKAGVLLDGGLTATTDIDLLVDARQHMSLAIAEDVRPEGVLGLLRRVDKSFERSAQFRAVNDEGYFVDLIAPMRRDEVTASDVKLGDSSDDLVAASILGLQWLLNAPKFEEVVIGGDGRPLWMSCIDPRAFALHKFWMSKRVDRDPIKRRRDFAQARAVTALATDYMKIKFIAKELTALPLELVKSAKELIVATRQK